MSVKRTIGSVFVASCLTIAPHVNAALEIAAKKASTSVGLAHTAANAWALETDPAISGAPEEGAPDLTSYYYMNGQLENTYDTSQFTLDTDVNGYPTLASSVSGLGSYVVTSFTVDYFANPAGFTDPGGAPDTYGDGYPSITVTASGLSLNPDADNNLPDINLPVGEVDDINFELNPIISGTLNTTLFVDGEPDCTQDQFFFQLNLGGPENPIITPALNMALGGVNGFLTLYDPMLNPDDPYYQSTTTDINPSEVPEPASLSLLALTGVGLFRRRRSS